MKTSNKDKRRAFLIQTEKLHPLVLKALKGREDILTFRQLQGEMAAIYRILQVCDSLSENQKFGIELDLKKAGPDTPTEKLEINTTQAGQSISQEIINAVFLKYLDRALQEAKTICLDLLLEEIQELPVEGSVEDLETLKRDLEKKKLSIQSGAATAGTSSRPLKKK